MHSDFKDLLSKLYEVDAEYLVVGAHALATYGHVRATKDLDVWIRPTPENATKVYTALQRFGAPLDNLTEEDLATPGIIFQIGVAPIRVDLLTRIDGVDFEDAWADRTDANLGGLNVHVLSRAHLVQNKKASGRLQDLADVERLEELGSDE